MSATRSFPIDFELHDVRHQPVIYIDDDPVGNSLFFELTNTSSGAIELQAGGGHHFELRFRPGTLADLEQVTLMDMVGWSLTKSANGDGTDSLYFLNTVASGETAPIARGETLAFTLRHISADGAAGARGTKVELLYDQDNINYAGNSAEKLSGSRVQYLSVVNHSGQRNIPLHAGFVGSSTVLNDGASQNGLTLRITNTSAEDPITLNTDASDAPSTFVISFDSGPVEEEWALGTDGQVAGIEIEYSQPPAFGTLAQHAVDNNTLTLVAALREDLPAGTALSIISEDGSDRQDVALSANAAKGQNIIVIDSWIFFDKGASVYHREDLNAWSIVKSVEGITAQWTITPLAENGAHERSLAPGGHVQFTLNDITTDHPNGHANLYLHYENIPGYWDGQLVNVIEKAPLVYRGDRVGIGTAEPRSKLDTGGGVLSGAVNDYQKAQLAMSGGGTVTWGGPGRRLKWTARFIAISMAGRATFSQGFVNVNQPTSDIPAKNVHDGQARSANANGVILNQWEALYAVHIVGGDKDDLSFRIKRYNVDFNAPSNWLLVAVVNKDDQTVKLGTGVIVSARSSSRNGSPLPCGTILTWSGKAEEIPGGWGLCDGGNGTPDLRDRFLAGAGNAYPVGEKDGVDKVILSVDELPEHDHSINDPGHIHSFTYTSAKNNDGDNADDRTQAKKEERTGKTDLAETGITMGMTGGGQGHENRPPFYALCFIMKLY